MSHRASRRCACSERASASDPIKSINPSSRSTSRHRAGLVTKGGVAGGDVKTSIKSREHTLRARFENFSTFPNARFFEGGSRIA
jgi:hypothetical protein